MKTHSPNRQSILKLLTGVCLVVAAPLGLFAQGNDAAKPPTADQFVGIYKGTAKKASGRNVDLKIEIRAHGSELYGRVSTPRASDEVFSPSSLVDGKLRIRLGVAGAPETLVLQIRDGKLVGVWQVGQEARALTFERLLPGANEPAVAVTKAPEPSAQLLTGEWEAAADAQGQTVPFTLVLKVDGEKVTGGSSSSQLGDLTISSGTWKDGKLAVVLEGGAAPIALVATLVEGKLVGDYDYGGQLQGKWVAAKKKP